MVSPEIISSAAQFLRLLWGDVPPGQVLVWRLPSKHSTWFQNFNNVDKFCAAHTENEIYTGVSVVAHDARVTGATRTNNINAAGIAGLWADIDLADPVHAKTNLPIEPEQATALLDPYPTVVVHSGHGLQCWWLFEKPWLFAGAAERAQAQMLSQWWQGLLSKKFERRGWTLDATHDLARVMRLPGTWNNKGVPAPVQVIGQRPERLILADLLVQLPAPSHRTESTPTANGHHLILNPDAIPPLQKFEALIVNSDKFARSWKHQRKDLLDQSPSAYDMSLAGLASSASWSEQEIADLLIAHRRKNGEDLKLREDYYQRTIDRARPAYTGDALESAVEPDAILEELSKWLGVVIEQMLRYDTNPVTFGAMVSGREVRLGEADTINSQVKFRNKLAGASLVNIPPISKDAWSGIAQKLLNICTTIDLGEETRPADEVWHLLLDYLAELPPYDDAEQAVKSKRPLFYSETAHRDDAQDDRRIAIHLPNFMSYITTGACRTLKRSDVTIWLRGLGCHPQRVSIPNYGQYQVWILPESIETKHAKATAIP